MENKIKIIALFGKSASGKDTIQKNICSSVLGTHKIISCTTRPKRDYEKEDVDYHFLTITEFTEKVLNGDMLEATDFNNWFYGTSIDSLNKEKINIGVFNIAGIEALAEDRRLQVIPIYVFANDKVRLLRSLNREQSPDCQEICRRFFTDEEDFQKLDFNFHIIENNIDFDREKILDIIGDFDKYYNILN